MKEIASLKAKIKKLERLLSMAIVPRPTVSTVPTGSTSGPSPPPPPPPLPPQTLSFGSQPTESEPQPTELEPQPTKLESQRRKHSMFFFSIFFSYNTLHNKIIVTKFFVEILPFFKYARLGQFSSYQNDFFFHFVDNYLYLKKNLMRN